MQVLIILAVFWLAVSLVKEIKLDAPLTIKSLVVVVLAIVGLGLALLACLGVFVLTCLAR